MWTQYSRLSVVLLLSLALATTTGCKKKHIKTFMAIVAVSVAAKIIYDMAIEQRSEQTENDKQVVNKYKEQHSELPDEPQLLAYQTNIMPGSIINPGNSVSIQSSLEVVRGRDSSVVEIKERITIYDNKDPDLELKSLEKVVNQDTNRCGAFKNEFTFTLPKGMPQGVYPIKTTVIVDGKEFQVVENKMQLVSIDSESSGVLIAAN
ncbi:MAG: hypothetical protein HWE13_13610 [Gammaproteobacteria bacterium]|nr:hypothetical protein [Gammaproteobacteria bacterium]NVK89166.1 hypothetical protein [Gammaproteobacteria bacterium]